MLAVAMASGFVFASSKVTVAVFAQGPIGLCATAGARLRGAGLVIGRAMRHVADCRWEPCVLFSLHKGRRK